jgi:aconitate hydratase
MGQAPARGSISVRTFNRNFSGRSGTQDDKVYLASPAVAAASAVAGRLSEPGQLGIKPVEIAEPAEMEHDESFLVKPPADSSRIMVERGPNIAPLGIFDALPDSLSGPVLLKAGDNVTTDDILPGGAKVLPYRSNIPKIARFTFEKIDPTFHDRAKKAGGGFIVGGENYGQGSSREHAAIVVRHLGVMMVLARGFARIHRANLIAQGVIPLAVEDLKFLSLLDVGAGLSVKHLRKSMSGQEPFIIEHAESGARCELHPRFEPEEREILLAGGLLNVVKGRTGRTQE